MTPGQFILIIEDNDPSRMLVRDVLRATGYQTAEARTAEEGIRLSKESPPALILMDIQLPGMNGLEALRHLRSDPATQRIPVMAVTASAMTHDRPRILAAGFDAYQTKPISVRELLETVRTLLEQQRPLDGP
jgi:two-component system cell cycle response regulator DivK